MKKLLICLILVLTGTSLYAQTYTVVARAQSSTELSTAKDIGVFNFIYPTSITKDQIINSANYYTTYFTVQYNETNHSIQLTMLNNSSQNRKVIMRFLMSSRLQKIKVDDNELFIQDFYNQYLN